MNIPVSSKYLSEIPTITNYNSGFSSEILKKVQNEKYQKSLFPPNNTQPQVENVSTHQLSSQTSQTLYEISSDKYCDRLPDY